MKSKNLIILGFQKSGEKMSDKINAVMIFEILGKPPEHLTETLSGIIDKMGKEKGVKVIGKNIREPKQTENSELYSSFAEVEAEIDSIHKLTSVIFAYMPSNIEILSPADIKFKNFDLTASCNEILAKLHNYDSVAKTLLFDRNNLLNELSQIKQKNSAVNNEPEKTQKTKKKKKR